MRYYIYSTVLFLFWCNFVQGQSIQSIVADQETKEVIPDVFIFLANSTIGTISNEQGYFELAVQKHEASDIVFSHINYELVNLLFKEVHLADTIFLTSRHLDLNEIVVSKKANPRIRKKRLAKFLNAFLGEQTNSKAIRILNSEVLLFKEENDKLIAEAQEPLLIENELLGYNIKFYLKTFEYDNKNGDVFYKGNAFFEVLDGTIKERAKFKKNRRKTYLISSRDFFSSLISHQLKEEEYAIGFSALNYQKIFVNFQGIALDSLQAQALDTNQYEIPIKGFLTITNKLVKLPAKAQTSKASTSFSTTLDVKNIKEQPAETATSFIMSKTNKIIVDRYGRILNPLDIEEYGYWANLRIASLLPFDYKF